MFNLWEVFPSVSIICVRKNKTKIIVNSLRVKSLLLIITSSKHSCNQRVSRAPSLIRSTENKASLCTCLHKVGATSSRILPSSHAMDFLKSAVASAISKGPPFPYIFGDKVDLDQSIWTLYNGTKRVCTLDMHSHNPQMYFAN